jgi:L-lactate dehydrogenase complex protein LldG
VTSRVEFLERVRTEMRKTEGLFPAKTADRPSRPAEAAAIVERQIIERWPQTLERFRREFERVGGVFHDTRTAAGLPDVIVAIARERAASRVVAWAPTLLGADVVSPLSAAGISVDVVPTTRAAGDERARLRAASAEADLGITGVDVAIAETGTLVLRSGLGRPRSTSLLPPTHVAVFDRTALIDSLAQLGVLLEAWHARDGSAEHGAGAMITLITGPSRTADIELTLTRGVHGPKEVHAVFVEALLHG